mgnify:CR=1 FL=1
MSDKNESMLQKLYQALLSEKTQERGELIIISIAIFSFILHLLIIYLVDFGIIPIENPSELVREPIAAIYTPFSFILVYEVYMLVYYLPKSIAHYIGKQYEIITLIVIRRIFKDLSNLEFTSQWFQTKYDLQFTYDLISTLVLFLLIFWYHRLNRSRIQDSGSEEGLPDTLKTFIRRKQVVAALLVPVLIALGISSFYTWAETHVFSLTQMVGSIRDVNDIFFNEFFAVLILTDVLLLLFSLFHTGKFHKVMRNSGFIISTILIRLSFGAEGVLNNALIVVGVLFGILVLYIHNLYDKLDKEN